MRERVLGVLADIESKMTDKGLKAVLEELFHEVLEKLRRRDSGPAMEGFVKTIKKQIASPRLESKVAAAFLLHSFLNQIPNKSRSDFHGVLDQIETEVAPAALNALTDLLEDKARAYTRASESYKNNLRMLAVLAILTFFSLCHDRFSQGVNGRVRRFDTFTQRLAIPEEVNRSFAQFANLKLNLLENRLNYFEKAGKSEGEDLNARIETLLEQIRLTRERLHQSLTNDFSEENFGLLYQHLGVYEEQLKGLEEAKTGKTKLLSEHNRQRIKQEDDFGRYIFEDFLALLKDQGSSDLPRLQVILLSAYEEIFPEEGTKSPAIVKSRTIMMPEIKAENPVQETSEFFEDNSNHLAPILPRRDHAGTPGGQRFNFSKGRSTFEEQSEPPKPTGFTNMFDKPQQVIPSRSKAVLESIAESEPPHYLSQTPAVKGDRNSAISVEPRKAATDKKVSPWSVDVPRKSRRFEEAFQEGEGEGMRDSHLNRSSFANQSRKLKESRGVNISGIEKKSTSSFMEGKSIVKFNFGGLRASSKMDSVAHEDRKSIVGEALSKVSTLMNQKKSVGVPIKQTLPPNPPPQPAAVQSTLIQVPSIVPHQPFVLAPEQPVNIVESHMVGPGFGMVKGGMTEQRAPFTPAYEDKSNRLVPPPRLEVQVASAPVRQPTQPHADDQPEVFDFNDFNSANSDKLETPPEQSIRDHSNIIPASLKGSVGRLNSLSTNLKLMNDFNTDFVPENESHVRTAISKKTQEVRAPRSDFKAGPDGGHSASTVFNLAEKDGHLGFDDPNYSAINQRLETSQGHSKAEVSDNSDKYSQLAIDENLLKDKKALEDHIMEQKQAFQALLNRTQHSKTAALGSSELERDLEVYKNLLRTLTADYDRLLANNRQEMKEFQQNIEAMAAQNEKYKHKIFKIENEVIALREERTRLKSHFSSQKAKYEENIARQRDNLLKATETKMKAMEKVHTEKLRTASLGSAGELNRIHTRNAELELAVKDLRLEVETIKNQKLNDLYQLKEKINSLKEVAGAVKADYGSLSFRVTAILNSRKLKDSKEPLVEALTAQAELSEKLKVEQKKNEDLRRQLVHGQTESNLMHSDLTFTHRNNAWRPGNTPRLTSQMHISNLRDSLQKFELWTGVALQGLSTQIVGLVKRNRAKVTRKMAALATQSSTQTKELAKLKFQSDLALQDYNHLKEKNHLLTDEAQALKRELVEAKKGQGATRLTQFDADMMQKYRQLQHEKDSLLELNKVVSEQNLQLKEKLALAETESNCTEKIMSVVRKLELENEELMSVNKALFNEVIHLKTTERPAAELREQIADLRRNNDQLRQIGSKLARRPGSTRDSADTRMVVSQKEVPVEAERKTGKASLISGTGFMKKINVLMDHLSAPQGETETRTLIDWLEENVAANPSLMAQICVNGKYNLVKMDALRLSVEESVSLGQTSIQVALTFAFSNMTNAAIAVEGFEVTCDSKHVTPNPNKPANFSVKAFNEGVLHLQLELDPQYLLQMNPIFVNFTLLGRRFSREGASKNGFFSLPLPLTLNKLVTYQQEDISKFPLIRNLQKVAEANVECPRGASAEVVRQVFPDMADVAGDGTAFWVKVTSFFGMFFMTVLVDESQSFNVKLFAMFESPFQPLFLRTVGFILGSI